MPERRTRGLTAQFRGQVPPLENTISGLRTGLLLAIGIIFLLLAANFQSLRLALAIVLTIPAALCGVLIMLLLTGTTLNVQSFMGAIMSIGIAVANSILLVARAEQSRQQGESPRQTAIAAARARMRPVLMTSAAMSPGMIPMALALGEGAEAAAPLAAP